MADKKLSKPAKTLSKKDLKKTRGGAKHIAGVKYEDITLSPPATDGTKP